MLNELVDAIKEPLSRGGDVVAHTQGSPAATPMETERPAAPVTLERPIAERHTEYSDTSSIATPGHGNGTSAGSSFTPTFSMPPGAVSTIPPSLDFLQSSTPPFVLSFGASLGSFSEGFAGSSTQSSAASQSSQPLSALSHEYSFLPPHGPLALQPASGSQAGTSEGAPLGGQGYGQFDMESGQMFGSESLGYNESMSFLPSISVSEPQADSAGGYAQPHHTLASTATQELDPGMPDFALMDDALMAWSDLPPAVG